MDDNNSLHSSQKLRYADRSLDATIEREIAFATSLQGLKSAIENLTHILSSHVEEQKAGDKLQAVRIERIENRVREIERLHADEAAVRKRDENRAMWVHRFFGAAFTAVLIWLWQWLTSLSHTASGIRPPHLLAGAVMASLLIASAASAATYYVSPSGSNTANGSITAPWATITYAAGVATTDDVVVVLPGNYPENVRTTRNGSAGHVITFRAETPGTAVIVPPANSTNSAAWESSGSYVTISGMSIDGNTYQAGTRWVDGLRITGTYNTATNMTITNIGRGDSCSSIGHGINVDGAAGAAYAEINANTVSNIGPSGGC